MQDGQGGPIGKDTGQDFEGDGGTKYAQRAGETVLGFGLTALWPAKRARSGKKAQNIIGTNLLTKYDEDRKINVASRVYTRKNAPPPGSHVFQPTGIIFELFQDIIGMKLLTKVLTRFYYSHITKNAPPLESHVFQAIIIIFKLIQDIIETNLLTKFHEDWTKNVASRVHICPAPWRPYFIGMNLLTKFHEDWTINVAARVHIRKNAPPLGNHVFQANVIIFKLIQDIIGTNLLTKFHEDRKINVASRVLTSPAPWWPYIIGMNLLTKFHEDQTINLASRVKNAPPLGSHVCQANVTIFELIQDIIETNLLTKFHEDWSINVASRELTRHMLTAHDARRTKRDHKSSP
ncbi:hypothetical protein DPMN_107402 [Dreissena polymorpha]|uniref:Uncharacterized protein n=1 Tax=Dreissena polymorpha TaxID=45954 RepID=A0A9D4K6Y1_DREPO|nr:hypothetical protein DPMN_107402 [Dreissena polymorpha]